MWNSRVTAVFAALSFLLILTTGFASAGPGEGRVGMAPGISPTAESAATAAADVDQVQMPEPVPLPPNIEVRKHVAFASGDKDGKGERRPVPSATESTLVYSNTLGRQVFGPGGAAATFRIADDIAITRVSGCILDKYVTLVSGDRDGNGSGVGPFTVTTALYETCPGAGGATPIAGTTCTFYLPDAGYHELTCVTTTDVELPTNFFFAVTFSRDKCGVVMGAPTALGFSADAFDFPGWACEAWLNGYPNFPHASFYLDVYVKSECDEAFLGYKNSMQAGALYTPGGNVLYADDIRLGVNECTLVGYEVGIRGFGLFKFDLRTHLDNSNPETGGVLPGTQSGTLSTSDRPQIYRHTIDPPITLSGPDLWAVFKTSSSMSGGVICTNRPAYVGSTDDWRAVFQHNAWDIGPSSGTTCWALELTVLCAGSPPAGACCDTILTEDPICVGGSYAGEDCFSSCIGGACIGEAVCRELPEMNCPFNRWMQDETCNPDPFVPACGLSACCTPDDTCEDLTKSECHALVPEDAWIVWGRNRFCDDPTLVCPFYACVQREGDCAIAHENPGCTNPWCCSDVCEIDPWCCLGSWDRICVERTQEICESRPGNDRCFKPDSSYFKPLEVNANSVTFMSNAHATGSESDPGFSCHRASPGARGFHTVWFTFQATRTSARVHTCDSESPVDDSILAVYRPADPSTSETACNTLEEIGCSDDKPGCGTGYTSDVCVTGLVPGETYYVQLASRNEDGGGLHQLRIESPCPRGTRPDCPPVDIAWIDPPDGGVDARRPPSWSRPAEGIRTFRIEAPEGVDDPGCWSVCETPGGYYPLGYSPIEIVEITRDWRGVLVITLDHAIASGALTAITYTDNDGVRTTGLFAAHPANVNGDRAASTVDMLFLIDVLNGMRTAPWGPYSTDCDRSGETNASDILCVIDLLRRNGPGERGWNGTRLPTFADGCHRYCGRGSGQPEWLPCREGTFCKYPAGQCQVGPYAGVCTALPDVCPDEYGEVCGCDGITYSNECYAEAVGVSVAHAGECEP